MSEPKEAIIAELEALQRDLRAGLVAFERQFDSLDARLDALAEKLDVVIAAAKERHDKFRKSRGFEAT